jgi:hypothetical protein
MNRTKEPREIKLRSIGFLARPGEGETHMRRVHEIVRMRHVLITLIIHTPIIVEISARPKRKRFEKIEKRAERTFDCFLCPLEHNQQL